MQVLLGNLIYSEDKNKLKVMENSYLVEDNGLIVGCFEKLPEAYKDVPVSDYSGKMIIPAFSDLHVHGPQYAQRGIGMDLLLSDWLNNYTFPEEAKFTDLEYADKIYNAFLDDMIRQGTFHASFFTTIHDKASDLLFSAMEKRGMRGYVGKVNMDCNSPAYLCENTIDSLKATEAYLERHMAADRVKSILTPRFAPTCTRELLKGLGELGKKYQCGVQTHIVESKWEAMESLRLFPDCNSDMEIYEKAGLLENGPVIMAHFIFPSEEDIRILKKYNGYGVHCPDATNNVIAGIMPAGVLLDEGINVANGSDIGAGHGVSIYRQISRCVQLSKLKEFYEPENNRAVTFENAFFMATKLGGSAFGKVGSLEPGYECDLLVIQGIDNEGESLSPEKLLERFCYIGDDRDILERYIYGKRV